MISPNNLVLAPLATKKRDISANRLLRMRFTVSKFVIVSVAKLGYTNLIFVEPEAKVNGQYYPDVLLIQELLAATRIIAGDVFVFQQDNTPSHRDLLDFPR